MNKIHRDAWVRGIDDAECRIGSKVVIAVDEVE